MRPTSVSRHRAIVAEELRTVVFTTAVMFLFALFLAMMGAGFGPIPFGEFAADLREGFFNYLFAAMTMLLVVEPVRHRGPAGGVARVAALAVAMEMTARLQGAEGLRLDVSAIGAVALAGAAEELDKALTASDATDIDALAERARTLGNEPAALVSALAGALEERSQ